MLRIRIVAIMLFPLLVNHQARALSEVETKQMAAEALVGTYNLPALKNRSISITLDGNFPPKIEKELYKPMSEWLKRSKLKEVKSNSQVLFNFSFNFDPEDPIHPFSAKLEMTETDGKGICEQSPYLIFKIYQEEIIGALEKKDAGEKAKATLTKLLASLGKRWDQTQCCK